MSSTATTILTQKLRNIVRGWRVNYNNERELQEKFAHLLAYHCLNFSREFVADKKNRPDFLVEGRIAVEVKIKGSLTAHMRQLERYANIETVETVILLCPKPHTLPNALNGKPLYCIPIFTGLL
jgi:hypothetical protein